jgi:hypothetical protein
MAHNTVANAEHGVGREKAIPSKAGHMGCGEVPNEARLWCDLIFGKSIRYYVMYPYTPI